MTYNWFKSSEDVGMLHTSFALSFLTRWRASSFSASAVRRFRKMSVCFCSNDVYLIPLILRTLKITTIAQMYDNGYKNTVSSASTDARATDYPMVSDASDDLI